ncbi:uncharacterized protein At3g17950-like [Rutidosis leptorrhynchoides]|uniref:uncharacterized protein At3g17950-like n=1 Tax=Rutidosis leptorrhynchoides TaxID=125765 RepID=UPI003A9A648F
MMLHHQAIELLPPTTSPTISSNLSSDFDTVSTGSFFPDRSTSLGALMGVTTMFPTGTFRTPPQRRDVTGGSTISNRSFVGRTRRMKVDTVAGLVVERRRKRVRRRKWWWLCGRVLPQTHNVNDTSKPSSLGEFLEFERRFEVDALFSDAMMDVKYDDHQQNSSQIIFANGRVLPPAHVSDVNEGSHYLCSFCRFPVLFSGLCGGVR